MAIPPLKKLAQRWWSELLKQAFFAPIFLLLIFVSLKLTEGLSAGVNDPGKGLANALAGGSFGGMGIIVTFMVVIGFMMASLIAAKSVGAMGTDMAMKGAGTIAMGSAGFVGRRTLGAASAGLASAARSRPALTNNFAGRALISGLDKGAHSSFDLRNSKSFSTVAGAAGANFGAGSKKSWHGMEEEEIKKKEKFAKSLKLSAADEANIEESKKQVKDTELEMVTEQNNFKETQQKAQAAIKSEEESVANVLKPQAAQLKAAKQAAEAAKEKAEITGEAGDKQAAVRLTTSYNASLQQYEAEKEAAEEKVQALKDVAEQEKKVYEERRKMQQAYVDAHKENEKWMAKNPQRRFAASLEQSSITPFMVTGHANHEAAKNIIKDINASEIAKLTKQLEKAASGGGGGGGDHGHAAPAAPKPKPAASGGGGGDHGHDH
ncbi:hypothetical protein KKH15_02125 [Patescibacteria group bacterium]|nr:hypothetical protein [Patescibacteria group bacterium]MBU1755076.1 hypothetical protein [Patescibacteria group bacterium]